MNKIRTRSLVVASALAFAALASAGAAHYFSGFVRPGKAEVRSFRVAPGSYRIGIQGDGDGDLDAAVLSSQGTVLDKDDAPDDNPVLSFTTYRTQTVRVVIANSGRISDAYNASIEEED